MLPVRLEKPTHSHQKLSTLASGKEDSVMDTVSKSGLMEPNMLVIGETIKLMAKASLSMLTAIFTKAIGPTTRLTDVELTST